MPSVSIKEIRQQADCGLQISLAGERLAVLDQEQWPYDCRSIATVGTVNAKNVAADHPEGFAEDLAAAFLIYTGKSEASIFWE